jgi:hypothetical protein
MRHMGYTSCKAAPTYEWRKNYNLTTTSNITPTS